MIKITKTSIIVFVVSLIFSFILTGLTYAQEENKEEVAKKLGITFPIGELGNCNSITECKSFCDNGANRDQCVSFAKKKGFYKQSSPNDKEPQKNEAILNEAKSELGCNSEESCRAVCENESNRDKCTLFASKHGLGGSRGTPGDRKILDKAKELLGCDSEATCRSVCENPDNQEKCSNFAKASGLGGGIRRVGPGGCNSEESCKAICEKNPEECRKFGDGPEGSGKGRTGPGGCTSEASCRAFCESNPEACKSENGAPAGAEDKFCRENPEKCAEGRGGPKNFDGQRPDRGDFGRDQRRLEERKEFGRPPESFQRPPDGRNFQAPEIRPSEEIRSEYFTPYNTPALETRDSETTNIEEVRGIATQTGLLQQILNWFGF